MFHAAMQAKYQNEAKCGIIVNGEENIALDGTFTSSDGETRSNIYHVPRDEILYRTIYSCFCEEAVSMGPKNTAFLKIVLTGNSFIYNQIRYMVGLAVAVVRGDVPLRYLEIALNGRVGVTLPKAPASGLLLYSYVFRPKHRMIINEKQRLEVLGINSNDESDSAATLTFHSPRHDALVEHFFETRIFPGIEADVDEVLSEWEAELAGSIPSPHYCKLLYEDQDQYKRQRSKYLAESRCQILDEALEQHESIHDKIRYQSLYTSLLVRYKKVPGKFIDDVYKAVLYDLSVTRIIFDQIPSEYLPHNVSGRRAHFQSTDDQHINHIKLNEAILDIVDRKGIHYYAARGASLKSFVVSGGKIQPIT